MKKLLSTLLCMSVIAGAMPMGAGAVADPIYIEDAPNSWSKTVIAGDVNDDGKLSIADAVTFQKCIMNKYDEYESGLLDTSKLDINFDGIFDVFDMVQMRQFVIHPETAPTQEWVIDALECDGFFEDEAEVVITTQEEFITYLSLFMKDIDFSKYTEKYDRDFFKENNLILKLFSQERGNGVYYKITASGRVNYADEDINFNGICLFMIPQYEHDTAFYPVTNIPMFVQVTIPKSQCCENEEAGCIDTSKIFPSCDSDLLSYKSPDGKTELCITQSAFLLGSDVDLYLKNSDGSFTPLTSLATDDGCCPFNCNGEWFTDKDGNSVFGDRENFTITWQDNGVIIDHRIDCDVWEKKGVTFDGEVTEYPTYNHRYVKWCEESYECGDNHVYKSPDGEHALRIRQYEVNSTSNHVNIEASQKASDGSCKPVDQTFISTTNRDFNNKAFYPFDQNLTEWSKDEDGNDVISNISDTIGEPSFRLTWKEDCVVVEYVDGYNPYTPEKGYLWHTVTIQYE